MLRSTEINLSRANVLGVPGPQIPLQNNKTQLEQLEGALN